MGYETLWQKQLTITPTLTDPHRRELIGYTTTNDMEWQPSPAGTQVSIRPEWIKHNCHDAFEDLAHLIEVFFEPRGYALSGEVNWYGEDLDDTGVIKVIDQVAVFYQFARDPVYEVDFDEDNPLDEDEDEDEGASDEEIAGMEDGVHMWFSHRIETQGARYLISETPEEERTTFGEEMGGFDSHDLADEASEEMGVYGPESTTPDKFYEWAKELGLEYVARLREEAEDWMLDTVHKDGEDMITDQPDPTGAHFDADTLAEEAAGHFDLLNKYDEVPRFLKELAKEIGERFMAYLAEQQALEEMDPATWQSGLSRCHRCYKPFSGDQLIGADEENLHSYIVLCFPCLRYVTNTAQSAQS